MAELTGLEVFALAKEIESGLQRTYVKNVYSLGGGQAFRFGRSAGEDVWLVASQKFGVWISAKVSERSETSSFTTKLRQELLRARFSSARQLNHDRVFDLKFGEAGDERHLLVEMMPPGNMIVTDSESRILGILNEVRSQSRRLLKGGLYTLPPQRRKYPAEASVLDVLQAVQRETSAGGVVGRHFALPRKYVAEALARLGTAESSPAASLRGREEEVVRVLKDLVSEAEAAPTPCVCETEKGEDIFVLIPRAYPLKLRAGSVSELCDSLLLEGANEEPPHPEPAADKRVELEKTIASLRDQESGLRKEAASLREIAGLAAAAATEKEVKDLLEKGGIQTDREGVVTSASAASRLFDRAKKREREALEISKTIGQLVRRRDSIRPTTPKGRKQLSRRKQEWFEKFRWFFTSEGKLAIGGKDAQSNSIIVRRHLESNDTVYHADLFGSPFFVLKGGQDQTEREELEVAQATVAFSSAWKTGLGAADAYWVNSDQVSTSAPSGEFLPRGGFLIRGKKNFVTHNLVELAIGLDQGGRVVSGPESSISKSAPAYVVLRPQKEKGSETAKRVLKDLESLAGGETEGGPSVDEVLRMLPAGGGKVLRKHSAKDGLPRPRNA